MCQYVKQKLCIPFYEYYAEYKVEVFGIVKISKLLFELYGVEI